MTRNIKITYIGSAIVFGIVTLFAWQLPPGDEMAFGLLGLYGVLPATMFVSSILLGLSEQTRYLWVYFVLSAAWSCLIPLLAFPDSFDWWIEGAIAVCANLLGLSVGKLLIRLQTAQKG